MKIFIALTMAIFVLTACPNKEVEEKVESSVLNDPIDPANLDFVMGKFDPAKDDRFVTIEGKYADQAGRYMQKEAYAQFIKMYEAAGKAGINLKIKSATRNFDYQKGIWERKWNGSTKLSDMTDASTIADARLRALKILEYSSMPGTSRHHWGTDIDLNAFENSWFESGKGLKLYNWMTKHASDYGFCQPYTAKGADRPEGYNEEKWHWSYIPLAKEYTDIADKHLKNQMIQGAKGAEVADKIDVKSNYILGINKDCL